MLYAHPAKFIVTKCQPGTYNIDIGGQKSTFTIADQNSGATSRSTSGGLIAIIIVGILILATIVVLLIKLRPA
jgi:hypothetical protein